MKKLWSEFYEFIAKGNVIALAIGLMMGAAFNAIVNSLINDVIMPIVGLLFSGSSFNDWFIALNGQSYPTLAAAQEAAAPVITIGNFIGAILNFLLIAVILFFMMKAMTKAMNARKKAEEAPAAPAEPTEEVKLLTEIRNLLAEK